MSKAPKLRFKEFSGDWKQVRIGDICKINGRIGFRGYTTADIVPKDYGALSLSPSNIVNSKLFLKKENTYISMTKYEESPEIKVYNGDIIFVKTGSTFGKVALIENLDEKATLNPQLVVLKNIKIPPKLLSIIMASSKIQKQVQSAKGGGVVPTLTQKELAEYKFYIPNEDKEQEKIASLFYIIDEKISLQSEKVEAIKDYKKGMMQKIFSRKLKFKDDEGRDYPEWEENRLGEVSDVLSGKRVPKGMNLVEYDTNIPYITVSDMGDKYVDTNNLRYITPEIEESIKKYKVKENDIIISVAGTLGKINIIDKKLENANLTENCDKITNFRDVYYKYIYYYLNTEIIQNQIQSVNTISSQPKLALNCIRDFNIYIPSYDEQNKIGDFLEAIDVKLQKEQEKLESLNEYKKGLLQQMFV